MARMNDHASLCLQHARQQQQLLQPESLDPETLAAGLLGSIHDFKTATAVNHTLARLFVLLARNRIPPRKAAVLAYVCQLLLSSLDAVKRETQNVYGFDAWNQVVSRGIRGLFRSAPVSDLAEPISPRPLPAHTHKTRPAS